ncbi:5884_t:CDS:2 [Entrophospora sp. SA101]|nr:5884_t:CDS:2 [Entrophospora sp. SA101]
MLENIQYSITSNISTTTNLDYASSSFDEGEESDSYDIRKFDLKYNNNNHRWSVSSSSSNSTTHEREKRRELQSAYDQTLQRLQDLEKTHSEDINALESDIQTLKKALVKESKGRAQLNKLFNESREKFGEEMQIWATKVIVMENQGNEMQETFKETISQLEKGEIEISRLRKENQMLQEPDEISKESKNTNDPIESSDAESVVTCSKITKLNNRIIELENELSIAKKDKLELESDKQITIKQLEEKQEKQATLLRANIAQKQKIIDDLNQELRKVRYSEGKREEKQKLLLKQNSINLVKEEKEKQDPRGSSTIPIISYSSSKDRKTSLTNSDSIEAVSSKKSPNIKKDKKDKIEDVEYVEVEVEGEQSELFSEEEEEEERDDKSSLCTGSENWAQSRIGSEENSKDEDDMLDAILSDREDRMLPLIGHYSAAEFTEDEDYVLDSSVIGGNNNDDDLFDRSISRRHSLASRFSGGSGGGRNAKLKFK